MIVLKVNPVGIDKKIQGIQSYLHENLTGYNLEVLGRAELKDKKPIVFYKKNDYKDVLFINPLTNGKVFFVDNETTKTEGKNLVTDVDIIFLLDVQKIKPNVVHRPDEEIRIEILEILHRYLKRTEFEITKGIEALKGFETKLKDLQPYHFVKYSFELKYNSNEC
ncbi:hypothetical protein [Flavobacterium sp. GT3P67]|uniref:hypothetical protein n=1 Tax=Flavobacterium sp. GT3P67 TaxID=2541722 RepID=UPI001052A4BF|nr:hypothetical protein [Flavobacterium sp. GT3P67]TDE53761.1 hypothetical protein E0H99_07025 [Flavobacterium sp. GT3P67]